MKSWQRILIPTLITLAVGGVYLLFVWHERQNPGVAGKPQAADTLGKDDLVAMQAIFPAHFDDLKRLEGTTVWMKNGYTIPYFAYAGGRVEFDRRMGLVPAGQRLDVKKIVRAAVPANVDDGVGHGTRQALAVFELPGRGGQFALPVGASEGSDEQYYTDLLFYYDDPHTIYDYWPKEVWQAIDAHEVKPGMSEVETRLALGQKMKPDGSQEGNRTVTYDQNGKLWTVTFVNNRATKIENK